MSATADRRRLAAAEALSDELTKRLELPSVPTVDGRVIVYATRRRGDQAKAGLIDYLRGRGLDRTVRHVPTADQRLHILEVSGAC